MPDDSSKSPSNDEAAKREPTTDYRLPITDYKTDSVSYR